MLRYFYLGVVKGVVNYFFSSIIIQFRTKIVSTFEDNHLHIRAFQKGYKLMVLKCIK